MKLANVSGRATVLVPGGGIDVERASEGRFGPDLAPLYDSWAAFRAFADGLDEAQATPVDGGTLGSPVPAPRQVFAIGLNYRAHAEESGMAIPAMPATFTKFPASLGRTRSTTSSLPGDTVDWEVELVAVIGERADSRRRSRRLGAHRRPHRRSGHLRAHHPVRRRRPVLTGQVVPGLRSDRALAGDARRARRPGRPRARLLDRRRDRCRTSRTSDLIFSVPQLVAELSAVLPLLPGDVIFTGTPAGVGAMRQPPRFLQAGEVLESWIEGIGTIRNRIIVPAT